VIMLRRHFILAVVNSHAPLCLSHIHYAIGPLGVVTVSYISVSAAYCHSVSVC
jgi:hypothetical protein